MAEQVRTGNPFLDAWIDILTPVAGEARASNGDASATSMPPFNGERNFLREFASSSASAFGGASDAALRLTELWGQLAQHSLGAVTAVGKSASAGDPLGQALENSFGLLGETGGVASEGPALVAQAAKTFGALCTAREAYGAVMLATWQRAFLEVSREAARRAADGTPVETPSQWLSLSNSIADKVFVEAFNSEQYIEAQRRLSIALADQRRSEMNLVECFARFGHFPTRSSFDELSKELSELRRRVRRLERRERPASTRRPKAKAVDER